jgi:hypothetical protein
VAVETDLALDIRQALSAVAQVEAAIAAATQARLQLDTTGVAGEIQAAVDSADTNVVVTGDATELTGEVTGAVDAADTAVTVTGDATEVTGSITGAVDAADSHVEVTADAPDVTGSINAAVGAADTHVTIDADDGGSLSSLAGAADDVNLALIAASGSGTRLRATIQAISAAGLGAGLFQAAQAASDLQESMSKASVVFGDSIDQVAEFGETSATSVGLAESAALEATGTFGNLFVALGTTKEEAAGLAPEVVQLGADLASFNNLGVEDTLERLRSGLVGEIEPLRSLGISFDAAAVEAKAMELGLADANGTISEGAKLQARWALILEQSGTAQGDFARTSEGLANQQRIVAAEFGNATTVIGEALLPALLEGVDVARGDLIPAFEEVGTRVLPALADAVIGLLPLAGSFAQILVSLAPVLEAVASAVGAIPPELITLVGLFAAFRKVAGSDFVSGVASRLGSLFSTIKAGRGEVKASVTDFVAMNAVSGAVTIGLSTIALAFQANAEKAAEFQRELRQVEDALETAFKPGVRTADALADTFDQLVEQGGTGASILSELGLSAEEFSRVISSTEGNTSDFAEALGLTEGELGVLKIGLDDFSKQVDQAVESQVEAIRASETLSDAYVDQVIKANTAKVQFGELTTSTVDYVSVLASLQSAQSQVAEQIGVTIDETGQLVEATGPAADAADRLTLALGAIKQGGGDSNLELQGLAIAAGDARIAEEDLQTVSEELGVSLDDLKLFVGSVNDAINQFADDTLGTLPSVGDIIGDLGDDFSPQALLDKLTEATEGIANFSTNLEDLAAFPRVQQLAAENGPLVAAALAKPVQDGNTDVIAALEDQIGAYDLHYAGLDAQLRNEFGPQIADATGLTAQLATEAFGADFNVAAVAQQQARGTIASIEDEDANMTAAAEGFGKSGTAGFSTGAGGMPVAAATYSDRSTAVVNSKRFAAAVAGRIFGGGFSSGTSSGSSGMGPAAADSANAAITAVKLKQKSASAAGSSLGVALAQGVQAGINSAAQAAANAAANLVEAAIAAARAKAKTGSPSKLFAELGVDLADGVVMGLEAGTGAVADAAAGLITTAAGATSDALAVDVRRFDSGGSQAPGTVVVQGVEGMFQVILPAGFDPAMAPAVGAGIMRGFSGFVQSQQVRTIARTSA